MSENVIAKRYATALIAAADAQKVELAILATECRQWAEWLASDDQGAAALLSPVLSPEQQLQFLNAVAAKNGGHKLMHGLLNVCLRKRRLTLLGKIAAALEAEMSLRSGTVQGEASMAFPLGDSVKQQIADKVGSILHKKTELAWREDRSLIGGFQVRVGHTIWNASLKHQLDRLGETIRKGVRSS